MKIIINNVYDYDFKNVNTNSKNSFSSNNGQSNRTCDYITLDGSLTNSLISLSVKHGGNCIIENYIYKGTKQ